MSSDDWIPSHRFEPQGKVSASETSVDWLDEASDNVHRKDALILPAPEAHEAHFSPMEESVEQQDSESTCDVGAAARSQPLRQVEKRNRSVGRWLLVCGGVFIAFLLAIEIFVFLKAQYLTHVVLGVFLSGLIVPIVLLPVVLAWREFKDIKRLRDLCDLQRRGEHFLHADTHGNASNYCAQVAALYQGRPDVQLGIEKFESIFQDSRDDSELR